MSVAVGPGGDAGAAGGGAATHPARPAMAAATMKIVARVQTMPRRLFWTLFIRPHPVAGYPRHGRHDDQDGGVWEVRSRPLISCYVGACLSNARVPQPPRSWTKCRILLQSCVTATTRRTQQPDFVRRSAGRC